MFLYFTMILNGISIVNIVTAVFNYLLLIVSVVTFLFCIFMLFGDCWRKYLSSGIASSIFRYLPLFIFLLNLIVLVLFVFHLARLGFMGNTQGFFGFLFSLRFLTVAVNLYFAYTSISSVNSLEPIDPKKKSFRKVS
jgi:hypothetical protein